MPSYWTRKKIYTHTSNLRALNDTKTAHKEGNKDEQTKSEKNNTSLTKSQNIEKYVCTYYEELFGQQINPKNPRLIPEPARQR